MKPCAGLFLGKFASTGLGPRALSCSGGRLLGPGSDPVSAVCTFILPDKLGFLRVKGPVGFSGALSCLIVRNTGFVPKEELLKPLQFPERGAQSRCLWLCGGGFWKAPSSPADRADCPGGQPCGQRAGSFRVSPWPPGGSAGRAVTCATRGARMVSSKGASTRAVPSRGVCPIRPSSEVNVIARGFGIPHPTAFQGTCKSPSYTSHRAKPTTESHGSEMRPGPGVEEPEGKPGGECAARGRPGAGPGQLSVSPPWSVCRVPGRVGRRLRGRVVFLVRSDVGGWAAGGSDLLSKRV